MRTRKLGRLTNHPATDVLPVPSPDGSQILFISDRDSLSRNMYVMRSERSDIRQLTKNSSHEESPDWSPDGDWLVYTAGSKGNYNIWKINIHTKEWVQLTRTDGRNEAPS